MQANTFKRNAYRTIAPMRTKKAFRVGLARKAPVAVAAQAAFGLKAATSHTLVAVNQYLLGFQLNDSIRVAATVALADVYVQLAVLARASKAKLPGSGKRIVLKGMTITEGIFALDAMATELMDPFMTVFDEHEVDLPAVKEKVEAFALHLYALTYVLLKTTPAQVMEVAQTGLIERFGPEYFGIAKEAAESQPSAA